MSTTTPIRRRLFYTFRNPVASSIYPSATSLDALQKVNASLTPSKRLPAEILLYVREEVQKPNALWEDIRAPWTPMTEESYRLVAHIEGVQQLYVTMIPGEKERCEQSQSAEYNDIEFSEEPRLLFLEYYCRISSADLLYRLLCYFPEIYTGIDALEWYNIAWRARIRHNKTGIFLEFAEHEAGATISVFFTRTHPFWLEPGAVPDDGSISQTMLDIFQKDSTRLLDAFFEAVGNDESWHMAYYHPAASADVPKDGEGYIAVSKHIESIDYDKISDYPYRTWDHNKSTQDQDISSYHSLLQDLKYNIGSRKIDHLNGTANLTTVISSATLLYRLVCIYRPHNLTSPHVKKLLSGKGGTLNSITSVWQFELIHRKTRKSVIFMDDSGLFDIRADEMTKEIMDDVEALVEGLCGDMGWLR